MYTFLLILKSAVYSSLSVRYGATAMSAIITSRLEVIQSTHCTLYVSKHLFVVFRLSRTNKHAEKNTR